MDTNIEMNQREEKPQMNPEVVNVLKTNQIQKNSRPVVPVLPDYKDFVEPESHRRIVSEINEVKRPNNDTTNTSSILKPDMELIWRNLVIETKTAIKGKDSVARKKVILDGVSGIVKTGECLAIIGSSGAGKTTLLNYLSKKTESKSLNVTGEVKLNGENMDDNLFSLISSYVMQDDILEATMTPKEILLFTAKLKLALPINEVEERVKNMIHDLNLKKCENTRIGDNIVRGVSGGERKRTSIAVELISDPKIIFLDEPTTGLDSYNAYEVIELLNILAGKGKMVIFTIHQPSSEIFYLLSKICILALGKTVFFGPKDQSLEFFDKELKLGVPEGYNPFEHFMEVTNVSIASNNEVVQNYKYILDQNNSNNKSEVKIGTNKEQENYSKLMVHFSDVFNNKKSFYDYKDEETIHNFSEDNKRYIKEKNQSTSVFYQFAMIFGRNIIISQRNKRVFFLKMVQSIFTAFFICILFARLSKDYTGIQDRLGVILMCITSSILNASISTVLVFAEEQKVFMRERANKLYSIVAYFLAKILSELPTYFLTSVIFGLMVFHSVEFNDTYSWKYYVFLGIYILSSFGGSSWGFFLGSLARRPEILINITTATSIPLLILSGFFANADNFAPYLIPLKYISLFKYAFQMFTHNEFEDMSPLNCQNMLDMCQPMATRFTYLEPYYVNYIATVALIIFFNLLAFMFIFFFAKLKV